MKKMNIEFVRLDQVEKSKLIKLMNNKLVQRHMPLVGGTFSKSDCDTFVAAKQQLWHEHGYGPWGIIVDGAFAGWGGLQPENGETDLALVLHPDYWGIGKILFQRIINRAFGEMKLSRVTALLPSTRTRVKGLLRLGFEEDGNLTIGKERFIRYRLDKSAKKPYEVGGHNSRV